MAVINEDELKENKYKVNHLDACTEATIPLSDLTSFLRGKGAILYCTYRMRVCCRVGGDGCYCPCFFYYLMAVVIMMQL